MWNGEVPRGGGGGWRSGERQGGGGVVTVSTSARRWRCTEIAPAMGRRSVSWRVRIKAVVGRLDAGGSRPRGEVQREQSLSLFI